MKINELAISDSNVNQNDVKEYGTFKLQPCKEITENGKHTADIGFNGMFSVDANVQSSVVLEENKEVSFTENGTYEITPSTTSEVAYDGMKKVTANVNMTFPSTITVFKNGVGNAIIGVKEDGSVCQSLLDFENVFMLWWLTMKTTRIFTTDSSSTLNDYLVKVYGENWNSDMGAKFKLRDLNFYGNSTFELTEDDKIIAHYGNNQKETFYGLTKVNVPWVVVFNANNTGW